MSVEPENGSEYRKSPSSSIPTASIGGRVAAVALLLLVPFLSSCKGSPTEPDSSNTLGVAGAFECLDGSRIQQFQLFIDGGANPIQDVTLSPASNLVTVDGRKTGVSPGSHRLSLKVVRQTSSPSRYSAWVMNVLVINSSGATTNQIHLADQNKTLGTGETIEYTFSTQ